MYSLSIPQCDFPVLFSSWKKRHIQKKNLWQVTDRHHGALWERERMVSSGSSFGGVYRSGLGDLHLGYRTVAVALVSGLLIGALLGFATHGGDGAEDAYHASFVSEAVAAKGALARVNERLRLLKDAFLETHPDKERALALLEELERKVETTGKQEHGLVPANGKLESVFRAVRSHAGALTDAASLTSLAFCRASLRRDRCPSCVRGGRRLRA